MTLTTANQPLPDQQEQLMMEAQRLLVDAEEWVKQSNLGEARRCFKRLLQIARPTAFVWERAAYIFHQEKQYDVARVHAARAALLSRRDVASLRLLFSIFYDQLEFDKAEAVLQELLARTDLPASLRGACHLDYSVLARRSHRAHLSVEQIDLAAQYTNQQEQKYFLFHQMFAYMCDRQWRQGLDYFENRFGFNDFPIFNQQHFQQQYPRWDEQPHHDRDNDIVFVVEEQGYGDMIQFARFLPQLRDQVKHLVVAAPPPLVRLLQQSPCCQGVVVVEQGRRPTTMTSWLPFASLPFALDKVARRDNSNGKKSPSALTMGLSTRQDAPYLAVAKTDLVAQTPLNRPTKNKKIGLVWSSGPGAIDHHTRSLSLRNLYPLLATKGVDFFSLQLGAAQHEIIDDYFQSFITDLSPAMVDFHATAELMRSLDAVISVDTAAIHLAAGLGVRTILLCPFESAWRWGIGQHGQRRAAAGDIPPSDWYPDVDIILQDNPRDWQGAVQKAALAVAHMVQDSNGNRPKDK